MKVAVQGERGSYSHEAAEKYFKDPEIVFCSWFDEAFDLLESGEVDRAFLPVENSYAGSVDPVNYLLLERDVYVVGEGVMRINHCLMAKKGSRVREVYSHPQALKQCERYLKKRELVSRTFNDTAGAARFVAESDRDDIGAIASAKAAEIYGLEVVECGIQDMRDNYTRFFEISTEEGEGGPKTSIVFSVEHRPGALYRFLEPFASRGINITRLESKPSRNRKWEYVFFMDYEGPQKIAEIAGKNALFVKILGSYRVKRLGD